MPSFWKRVGLAAALAAQIAAGPSSSFAQQPSPGTACASNPSCAAMPCGTGHAHVGQVPTTPCPQPPPWVEPSTPEKPVKPEKPETPSTTTPDQVPPVTTPEMPETPELASLSTPQAGLGTPDTAFGRVPNMMGDLLRGFRSVNFQYNGGGDFAPILTAGSTTLRNSKVAENNSAIPRDRFTFRYNFFNNATAVQGYKTAPDPNGRTVGNFPDFEATNPNARIPVQQVIPATKSYNAHFYTFGFEKTFWDQMASLELRIPFATTLSARQNFIASQPVPGTGAGPGLTSFAGIPVNVPVGAAPLVTPGTDVLGATATQIQDLSFILKRVLYISQDRRFLMSGGMGVTAPTAPDVKVSIVDSYDDPQLFEPPGSVFDLVDFDPNGIATNMRRRDITVKNQIWDVAPFLAMVATPTNRTFVNGFMQVDVPLNSADVYYRETRTDIVARDIFPNATATNSNGMVFGPNGSEGTFRQKAKINGQSLLQMDIGGGYWLYRNPAARRVTGLASLMELHYTSTLENADIVTFQPQPSLFLTGDATTKEAPTRIGNLANRVDILNLTLGGVVQVANAGTLAVGYVAPLRSGFNRTFDGELNVQFNVYR